MPTTVTPEWSSILLLLLFGLICLSFLGGLVMFIVGLCVKKRGLWITGLILVIIPIILGLIAAGAVGLSLWFFSHMAP